MATGSRVIRWFSNSDAKVAQKKRAAKNCYSFATDATRLLLQCYRRATRCSIFGSLRTEMAG
jgi:hypothetical protein